MSADNNEEKYYAHTFKMGIKDTYPHILKVDDKYFTEQKKNSNLNNLQNLENVEDYICIFENNGKEFPEIAMGLAYRQARSKDERKEICENKSRVKPGEARLYIRRDDWLNPDLEEYECGAFDRDGKRLVYDVSNEFMKFPSKSLCDSFSDKNSSKGLSHPRYADVSYTKMVPKKIKNPVIDLTVEELEDEFINSSRAKVFWFTYILIAFIVIFWTIAYHTEKPYSFYDYVHAVFMNRVILILILFGMYVYLFCPFGMCSLDVDAPTYRRDFTKATKNFICDYSKEPSQYLESGIVRDYDNSYYMKYFDIFINFLFSTNRQIERPLKNINGILCNYCSLDHECIDRAPYNIVEILRPIILEVQENSLLFSGNKTISNFAKEGNYEDAINLAYKFRDNTKPYDTGSIIMLKSNNKELNNILYMSAIILKEKSSSNNTMSDINGEDYEYKWIKVRNRKDDFYYDELKENLRIKRCPVSFRVFAVATNYELLGYNIELDIPTFIEKFEYVNFDFFDYPYYPGFTIEELNSDGTFFSKPDFVKRRIVMAYKYFIRDPNYKFRTKNISFIDEKLIRYDTTLSSRQKIENTALNNFFIRINLYLQECKKYKFLLSELTNYHNDDEDDEDYLLHFNKKHIELDKNFYLVADYNYDFNKILDDINLDKINNLEEINEIIYKLYKNMINLNYLQRDEFRSNFVKIIMKKFEKIRQIISKRDVSNIQSSLEFLKYRANEVINISEDITFKYGSNTIVFKEHLKLMEYVSEHMYEQNYKVSSIENVCKICSQSCELD